MLSLFSGAGGLDLGLERAGFDPVLCLDSDSGAQATLRHNRPNWDVPLDGDVTAAAMQRTCKDLGLVSAGLDLMAGGPPCQPFSKAAQWTPSGRTGLKDPRTRALGGFVHFVEVLLPRVVLVENVPGFVSGPASALRFLEEQLAAINERSGTNYRLNWWLVDAADYGVPQRRKRAILVAFRDGRDFRLPAPTHSGSHIRAWDVLYNYMETDPPNPRGSWTGLLPSIPEGHNYQWLTARGGGIELFGWRTRYWSFLLKLARDRPSWTLPASPGPNTGPFHWDNRPLSTRERLRLQSFPDDWALTQSEREQWRMAGNATPPLLAEIVGRAISSELGLYASGDKPPTLALKRVDQVPPPTPPVPVKNHFAQKAGPKLAHPGPGLGPAPRTNADQLTNDKWGDHAAT
jgi:DNA (cytosine-5)-methyltransferase 1